MIHTYDWRPDRPDSRDFRYAIPPLHADGGLPPRVDLRPHCPPVYDQGQLGACTGNALAALCEFLVQRLNPALAPWIPSRLFIYWNERAIEGDTGQDGGAALRDGMAVLATKGVPPESVWPYEPTRFAVKPPSAVFAAAYHHKISEYLRLDNTKIDQLRSCLAGGFPFAFGFTVCESFESREVARTGVVSMPSPGEQVLGGHAVLAVGYDDAEQAFLVRNSWGAGWGRQGYFRLPYAYGTSADLASDFWTARKAS